MHTQTILEITETMIGQFGQRVHICPQIGAMEPQLNTRWPLEVRRIQMQRIIFTILITQIIGTMETIHIVILEYSKL